MIGFKYLPLPLKARSLYPPARLYPLLNPTNVMALVDLVMQKKGESIMEATILKWHKNPGDTVRQDETVLEIATDKVDSEVPSAAEGILEEILYQVNDVVPIGSVIARIRTNGTAT